MHIVQSNLQVSYVPKASFLSEIFFHLKIRFLVSVEYTFQQILTNFLWLKKIKKVRSIVSPKTCNSQSQCMQKFIYE